MAINPLNLPAPLPASTFELDFSSLAKLPEMYREREKRQTLADLGKSIESGQPLDYQKVAGKLISQGDLSTGMSLLQLGRQRAAAEQFGKDFGGGGTPAAPAPAGTAPGAASAAPMSNSTPPLVMGTNGKVSLPDAQGVYPADATIMPGSENLPKYASAISGIESGGRYDIVGPAAQNGDRPLGKYQVMASNVGPWTEAALGTRMTPQQFLANPAAQDAVFNHRFGSYVEQYGNPQDAASAWFTGKPLAQGAGARDQLGTTGQAYVDKFNAGLNAPRMQVASNDPAALPPNSTPTQGYAVPGQPTAAAPPVPGAGNQEKIGKLFRAVANPDLPQGTRDAAKVLLEHTLKASDLPEAQKNYVLYRAQGGTDDFTTWDRGNKKSGATSITIDQKGEASFESEMGKKQADRWNGYITAGQQAQSKLVDFQNMRELSRRIGSQGAAAGFKEALGPYAEALGINIEGLPDIQAYTSIIQRLAPQMRAIGSGSTSDIEFKGFIKSLPGLSQNPQAREMTLDTFEALARNQMAEGEIASRLASKEITRGQAEKELRALPDPLTGFREWRKANPDAFSQAIKTPAPQAPAANKAAQPKLSAPEVSESVANARAAIKANPAIRDAVIKRLQGAGIDPSGL